jgi:hypothetical protein
MSNKEVKTLNQLEQRWGENSFDLNHKKSTIYKLLGDLIRKIAERNYQSFYVKMAFDFYQQSLYFYHWHTLVS